MTTKRTIKEGAANGLRAAPPRQVLQSATVPFKLLSPIRRAASPGSAVTRPVGRAPGETPFGRPGIESHGAAMNFSRPAGGGGHQKTPAARGTYVMGGRGQRPGGVRAIRSI